MTPEQKKTAQKTWLAALKQTAENDPKTRFQLFVKTELFLREYQKAMTTGNALWEEILAPGEEGISFAELADKAGVSESYVSQRVSSWAAVNLVEVKPLGKKRFVFPNWEALNQMDNFLVNMGNKEFLSYENHTAIKALTNPTNFLIYTRLLAAQMTVGEIATSLSAPVQANVIMSLKGLESAGIVESVTDSEAEGRRAYRRVYRITWFWDALIAAAKNTFVKHGVFSLTMTEII